MIDRKHCTQPDRDEPRIECGYTLPCPYHTAVIDSANDLDRFLSRGHGVFKTLSGNNVIVSMPAENKR